MSSNLFLDKRVWIILGITLGCFIFYYILLLIGMYEEGLASMSSCSDKQTFNQFSNTCVNKPTTAT